MATSLISAGVSVEITDESFYIPSSDTTIPLFFIATASEKYQPDGVSKAAGTYESNVIRIVTSLKESIQLYGIPRFLTDTSGNPLHGDSRNEYGLFALNQYLTVGNYAYVIRADVDLNDNLASARLNWDRKVLQASYILENLATSYINNYNVTNAYSPSDPLYKETLNSSELLSLIDTSMEDVWDSYNFRTLKTDFESNHTLSPLLVYASGYSSPPTSNFIGLLGEVADWVATGPGSTVPDEWLPTEASTMLISLANQFKYTKHFMNETSLGANDVARRNAIVTALRASIASNTDIRSESYEYNIIACPGYHETTVDLLDLNRSINEEALVVGELPMNMTVDQVVAWEGGATTYTSPALAGSVNLAVYYPHGVATNLDGKQVFVAASGIAIKTIAFSDKISQLWFAPAGTRRGLVTGVSEVGYITGTLGSPTTFVPLALNKGQRDSLYKFFTNINPIVYFPSRGILVWGQKTQAPDASALDRVNVVRLLHYIKRSLRKNTMPFIFEPNDKLTRDNIKALVDSFLSNLIVKRALYDYATVCDESNNTPDRIDRNELYVDIALKPVKAVEFIYIPIRVVTTAAEI